LTFDQFNQLRIVSERYVIDGIKDQEIKDIHAYDLGALFKLIKQNNKSIFEANENQEEKEIDTL